MNSKGNKPTVRNFWQNQLTKTRLHVMRIVFKYRPLYNRKFFLLTLGSSPKPYIICCTIKTQKVKNQEDKKSSATNPAKKKRFHIRTFLLEDSAFTLKRSFRGLQRPPRLRFQGGSPRISVHLKLSIKSVTMIIEVLRLNPK